MMLIKNIITLDQLESTDYLYKLLTSVLPSLCLDYKIDPRLGSTYVHIFDLLFHSSLKPLLTPSQQKIQADTVGINYLLSRVNAKSMHFPVEINGPRITETWDLKSWEYTNPIHCTVSFKDLPPFTKLLLNIRVTSFEEHARYFGGYVAHPEAPAIKAPTKLFTRSFPNNYLNSLTYPYAAMPSRVLTLYRPILKDGVMVKKDLLNLLNVRALLMPINRQSFDFMYKLADHAQANSVTYEDDPKIDRDLVTMSYKYLIMYFQWFSSFRLGPLYLAGEEILINNSELASLVISTYYQKEITYLVDNNLFTFEYKSLIFFTRVRGNRADSINTNQLGIKILQILRDTAYIISVLNITAKSLQRPSNIPESPSLFWDGISYEEYKNLKFMDMMFIGSTCYIFALYNKNEVTYCSLLNDVLKANEVPTRICILPRWINGKTIPVLVSEILESINNMTIKDFPKYDTLNVKHIGLSDNGFFQFFQLLRLMENKEPHMAIKEILMSYIGIKIIDKGTPYYITPEGYKTFIMLLCSAMGFTVKINKNIISSHNFMVYNIYPKISKRYFVSMLQKAGCSQLEADKLLSSSYDLISFLLSISHNRDNYRQLNKCFLGGYKDPESDLTCVQFMSPLNILDRINIKGILSASALNEMLDIDLFLPENMNFKANLEYLKMTDNLTGKNITHILPLNTIDRLLISGGGNVSVGELLDNIDETAEDKNVTNEVVELITEALRDTNIKNSINARHVLDSATAASEKQMDSIKRITCQGTTIFKELAMHIYFIERYFKGKVSDEFKIYILDKYRDFIKLSISLYRDLIGIDQIKSILSIIHRTGSYVDDTPITQEDIQKAYNLAKPKIVKLSNYYTEITKTYFNNIKKIMNPADGVSISFEHD